MHAQTKAVSYRPWRLRAKDFVLWLLLCALLATIAHRMPPMQSPDETQHIGRAWMLGHGQWLLTENDGRVSGGRVDPQLFRWVWAMFLGWTGPETQRTPKDQRDAMSGLHWSEAPARESPLREGSPPNNSAADLVFAPVVGTGYYLPVIYVPHALGLRMGEAMHWSIDASYRLARALCHMLCAALLLAAWRQCSRWRPPLIVLGFLTLPMTLFQFAAPTIDGITNAMAMLVISITAHHYLSGQRLSAARLASLIFCLLILGTTRLHLVPMIGCLPLLAARLQQRSLVRWALALLALCIAWTLFAALNTLDLRIERPLSSFAIAAYYLGAPLEWLGVVARTLGSGELVLFYLKSFVGVLGWLDTPLAQHHYLTLLGGLLGLAALQWFAPNTAFWPKQDLARTTPSPRDPHQPLIDKGQNTGAPLLRWRIACGLMAIASAAIIFSALLATWSKHPAQVIEGVQGRYFLIPAILLACALLPHQNQIKHQSLSGKTVTALALFCFSLWSLWVLMHTLEVRYGS